MVPRPVNLFVVEAGLHTNALLKWTRLWTICFRQDKRYIRIYKEITSHIKGQTNDNLRRSQFLLNCKRVICRWRRRTKWRWLEIKHWRLARQRPLFLLQNTLKARMYPNNYCLVVAGCCSNVLKQLGVIFSESKPLNQLWSSHRRLLTLRLRFLNFFRVALFTKLNRMFKREFLISGVQQLLRCLQRRT